jgi:hypothetical protein
MRTAALETGATVLGESGSLSDDVLTAVANRRPGSEVLPR